MDFARLNTVSWYPGHMLKAERQMREKLGLIDVVVEVVDARCPQATRNPAFAELVQHRAHVIAMGKADLADPDTTRLWARHFEAAGLTCQYYHHHQRDTIARLLAALQRADAAARRARGSTTPRLRPLRAMIVGFPNVGKSSLINLALGKKRATVGPRPGVTRHQQWIALSPQVELLDTPGIFVPRVADPETGLKLGLVAALKDEHVGEELLAEYFFYRLHQLGKEPWKKLYSLEFYPDHISDLLDGIARSCGFLRPGGVLDRTEAAKRLLHDLRAGKLGQHSFETPPTPAPAPADRGDDDDDA